MKLKIFLHVLLCLTLNGREIYAGLSSSHFNNFGCIVRTNVTIFYPNTSGSLFTMVKYLDDPCITIFIYFHHKKQIVQWMGDENEIEAEVVVYKDLSASEYLEFIQNLHHQEQIKENDDEGMRSQQTNQVLLLSQARLPIPNNVSRAIESLDKQTKWNVIILCTHHCPILHHLPINRIFPILGIEIPMNLKSLVKNPEFNKNEYQKNIRLNEPNLPCLANKTIHVFNLYYPLDLIIDISRIMHNTRQMNTKIILYVHTSFWSDSDFWTFYIEQNGWKDTVNIVFQNVINVQPQLLNTNEIYLISEIFLQSEYGKIDNENFCENVTGGRKSIAFYKFNKLPESSVNSTKWFDGLKESCKRNFRYLSFNTKYDTEENFNEDFLNEIMNASCVLN